MDGNDTPCRMCNGEGAIMRDTLVGPQPERCDECNGSGWVPSQPLPYAPERGTWLGRLLRREGQ